MPSSSTRALYNGNDHDTKPRTTNDDSSRISAIGRFLTDQEQYHPAFSKAQSPTEAEAAAEARMAAQLRAFEQQLASSDKSSSH